MFLIKRLLLTLIVVAAFSGRSTLAENAVPELLKIAPEEGKNQYLMVPVVTYVRNVQPGKGATLDFVGAVHLGEPDYFEELNKKFKGYDAVLYELIADPDRIKHLSGTHTDSLLGTVQRKMSELLGLTFQLDKIDYGAPNFVHADLTPTEFSQSMRQKGESLPQMLIKLLQLSMSPEVQKKVEASGLGAGLLLDVNPLFIVLRGYTTDKERTALKKYMAKGLTISDELMGALEGDQGSSIIGARNQKALDVLNSELSNGKRNLALYYGVGHLSDLHRKLVGKMGFEQKKVVWLKAWKL